MQDIYTPQAQINSLYNNQEIDIPKKISPNSYFLARNGSASAICRVTGKGTAKLVNDQQINNTIAKVNNTFDFDINQLCALDAMLSNDIQAVAITGIAGTGKTVLTLLAALTYFSQGMELLFSKPAVMVGQGKAFGPVPGDVDEKYSPFLGSFEIALEKAAGHGFANYLKSGERGYQFVAPEYTRGCTFSNSFFVLDEFQNLSWHELKTVITRMDSDTKLVMLGDLQQSDIKAYSGANKLLQSKAWKHSSITSHVHLTKQYRSPLANLVMDIEKEQHGS